MSATVEIFFNQTLPDQYILVQLTPDILDQELYLKPASSNSTVLCTGSSTYQLKDVQQSNSLLFLGESEQGKLVVQGEAVSWLESVIRHKPRIDLSSVPIFDGKQTINGIARATLYSRLPASDTEINAALRKDLCVMLDSGYVKLEPEYVQRLLKLLVDTIIAEGIDPLNFELNHLLGLTRDDQENEEILSFLLQRFAAPSEAQEAGENKISIDGLEVAKYTGLVTLLLHADSPVGTTKFAMLWSQATPLPYQQYCKDFEILVGHYIQPVSTQIQYFASDDLSTDGKQRIAQLLEVRERWSETEIMPFLLDLEGGAKSAQSLIMKHARKVKVAKTTFIERRGR